MLANGFNEPFSSLKFGYLNTIDLKQAKSWLEKGLWFFMCIAGTLLMFIIVREQITSWDTNPIIISKVNFDLENVDFPAITFCPLFITPLGPEERLMSAIVDWGKNLRVFRSNLLELMLKQFMFYDFEQVSPFEIENFSNQYSLWMFTNCVDNQSSKQDSKKFCKIYQKILSFTYQKKFTMLQTYQYVLDKLIDYDDIMVGIRDIASEMKGKFDKSMLPKNISLDWLIMENLFFLIKPAKSTNISLQLPVNIGRNLAVSRNFLKEEMKTLFNNLYTIPSEIHNITLKTISIIFNSKEFNDMGFWQFSTSPVFDKCFYSGLKHFLPCANETLLSTLVECKIYCLWHNEFTKSTKFSRQIFLNIMKLSQPIRKAKLNKLSDHEKILGELITGKGSMQEPKQTYASIFMPLFCKFSKDQLWQGDSIETFSSKFCSKFYSVPSDKGICLGMNNNFVKQFNINEDYAEVFDMPDEDTMKIPGKRLKAEAIFVINTNFASRIQSERNWQSSNEVPRRVKFHIHSANSLPLLSRELNHEKLDFQWLEAGYEYTFGVSPIGQIGTERFLQHGNKKCFSQKDKIGADSSLLSYSKTNCIYECKVLYTANFCRCIPWEFKVIKLKTTKMNYECDVFGRTCFFKGMSNFTFDEQKYCPHCVDDCVYMEYPKHLIKKEPLVYSDGTLYDFTQYLSLDENSNCIKRNRAFCQYARDTNHTLDPESWMEKLKWNTLSPSSGNGVNKIKSLIIVHIKFESNVVHMDQLDVKYTTLDRIANLGGTIGVAEQLSGASLLTLIHLFILITRILCVYVCSKIFKQ